MTGKRVVRADGVFEAALGLLLAGGAATSRLGPGDFPTPVGTPAIVVVGCALLIVGVLLWRLASGTVAPSLLGILAGANAATAAAALVWRLLAAGFSSTGSTLAVATVAVLAVLAAAQLNAARVPAAGGDLPRLQSN